MTPGQRKRLEEQLREVKNQKIALLEQKQKYQQDNRIMFFDKPPNPGPNPPQAKLFQAWKNPRKKVFTFTGGNRCLGPDVKIYDPVRKISEPISKINGPFHVLAWDGGRLVTARAERPFMKGTELAYEVSFSNGGKIVASAGHQILTPGGYASVGELHKGCAVFLPPSSSGYDQSVRGADVRSFAKKVQDFLYGCLACSRSCDGQLHAGRGCGPRPAPSQDGVQVHNQIGAHSDATGHIQRHTRPCLYSCRPSIRGVLGQSVVPSFEFLCRVFYKFWIQFGSCIQAVLRPTDGFAAQLQPIGAFAQQANPVCGFDNIHDYRCFSKESPPISRVAIEKPTASITNRMLIGESEIWDFHVPGYNNYFCEGAIHHNSGKSTTGVLVSVCTAAGEWLWTGDEMLFPHNKPRKIRIVGQDFEKHIAQVVIPELHKWWPKSRPVKIKRNSLGIEAYWTDEKTGSTIEVMSNNQDSELHEGWQGDLIYYDEPPRREIRIANARGLVDRQGRELFCMTLLKEAWVDRDVIKARDPDGRPDRSVFNVHATIYDNVGFGLTQEGIEQFAKTLNADEREARLMGIPSYMSGLVLKHFDRDKHIKTRFDIPLDWPVDIGIDIHPRTEQAVLFVATSPRGDRYACFEIWEFGSGEALAEKIVRIVRRHSLRANRVVVDPLAKGDANNENTVFERMARILARHDMPLEVATKDKDAGILEINSHLRGPNNEPSLFFFDDLVRTLYEAEGWVYDKDTQKPAKVDDHMMENLYRILLLNTQYTRPEEEDGEGEDYRDRVNESTGY